MKTSCPPVLRILPLPHLDKRFLLLRVGWHYRISRAPRTGSGRFFASVTENTAENKDISSEKITRASASSDASVSSQINSQSSPDSRSFVKGAAPSGSVPPDWDENPDLSISTFSQLPSSTFGYNQHMIINSDFKEALRQILWQFRAPIRYAVAYGSGVFPQTASPSRIPSAIHPNPSPAISSMQGSRGKMIDFIFGVTFTQHWHSLNLQHHRDHYSAVGSLGSSLVSRIQDNWGAGVYFNPFVTVNGTLIKYGVVNLDTLCRDLSEWDTLYLAGRLHKPVKILRDDARVRLANQINLISAVRTALLLLPSTFTEQELYSTIAGISYLGDPRMALPAENQNKVANIIKHQLPNFRRLYAPLIETLPNVAFHDSRCNSMDWKDDPNTNISLVQDMDPKKRGNMVRRLPRAFRSKLYFRYQSKLQIPQAEFEKMMEDSNDQDPSRVKRQQGGVFEQKIANDNQKGLQEEVRKAIKSTVQWPSVTQTLKSVVTAGVSRSWRYAGEKIKKYRDGQKGEKDVAGTP